MNERKLWFAIYEFHNVEHPRLLRLVKARTASGAVAKAIYGDESAETGGIVGTVHVHTIEVQDYCVPRTLPVRTWDGTQWHPAGTVIDPIGN